MAVPVIAIFDIGKTNKKAFLFDEDYRIVFEKSTQLPETKDEDGFPCEDIHLLTRWVTDTFAELKTVDDFEIKAVNVSAHGASFVHLDAKDKLVTPLYNYLKPYPIELQKKFYQNYGGENEFARVTASPVLGHLNSGMQLYWLRHHQPKVFKKIQYSLHLPEYISFLLSGEKVSGITSIGCHTNLWNFDKNDYHEWVTNEGIKEKLAPIISSITVCDANQSIASGIGLHDSSSALIPYMASFEEPFVLLSTGTWCISLNPFNHSVLTEAELKNDCLCYLSYKRTPVKASRLFAGHEHDEYVKKLSSYFNKSESYYTELKFSPPEIQPNFTSNLSEYERYETAYATFMKDLVDRQNISTGFVLKNSKVKRIFVDGGFSKNDWFMNLLANAQPSLEVYAATMAQASAMGAALAIHSYWNRKPVPKNLIELKRYLPTP